MNDTNLHENTDLSTYAAGLLVLAKLQIAISRSQLERFARLEGKVPPRALATLGGRYDKTRPSIAWMETWAPRRSGTYVLEGPVGTGKTFTAALYALVSDATWSSAASLSALSWEAWPDVFARLSTKVSRLVIDELGGPGSTPVGVDRAVTLIKLRHENMLQTLVTTNLHEHDFALALEGVDSASSRVCDCIRGDGEWFTTGGSSGRTGAPVEPGLLARASKLLRRVEVVRRAASGERFCGGKPHVDPDPDPLGDGRCRALHEPEAIDAIGSLQHEIGATKAEVEAAGRDVAEQKARLDAMIAAAPERFRSLRHGDA